MKRHAPAVEMVLADPAGSILADEVTTGTHGEAGSWLVEGIGEDFVPLNCDLDLVRKAYSISDAESMLTARDLLLREGIFAGSSAGTSGGRSTALLSRADAIKACRDDRAGRRRQISVQAVQRLLADGSGHRRAAPWAI